MSAAGFLEKLLGGAEVEWVPLGHVTQPTANIKWSEADGVYRYIDLTSVDIKAKRVTETSEISAETAPSRAQKLVQENDVIFATTRPAQQRYCLIDSELAGNVASTGYCVLRAKQDQALPKWILHWLSTTEFMNYVEENQSGAAYPAISDGKVKAFKIPIPCTDDPEKSLAIQREIVRILDSFTELTAELTAELTQRKKQYNHYRDRLLSFEGGDVEWKPLDEIGEFIRGKRFTKADYVDEGIGAIHYGEIYTHYGVFAQKTLSKVRSDMAASLRYAEPNDVVIAGVSETIEDVGKAVAWLGEEKVAIHDDSYAFRHNMNPKFIAYAMQTDAFHDQKAKYVSSGKIKRLLIDGVKNVQLPVPFPDDPTKSAFEKDSQGVCCVIHRGSDQRDRPTLHAP
ncbi:restriction endonuclease subunit S, partial [Amorphus sp. MBR-141]